MSGDYDGGELDDGRCCVTCMYGSLVKDIDRGYVVFCHETGDYMPCDHVCGSYEF